MDIALDSKITSEEIVKLRKDNGWDGELSEWKQCLRNTLCVVLARENSILVGVGFITGTVRHAELVDLVVDQAYKEQGIGRKIVQMLNAFAKEKNIKYYGLTYDKTFPWLKEFYATEDFESIDFAMWHRQSLSG